MWDSGLGCGKGARRNGRFLYHWHRRSYVKENQKGQGGIGWIQGRGRTAMVASSMDKLKRYPTHQYTGKEGECSEEPTGKELKRGRTAMAAFPNQVPYHAG